MLRLRIPAVLVLLSLGVARAHAAWGFQANVHPECHYDTAAGGQLFERIEDISALLHGQSLPTGVCVFNPSVTQLQGDLLLWAARAYTPRQAPLACIADPRVLVPPITSDSWKGTNSLVLAVTRTMWGPDGRLNHTLVGLTQVEVKLEDGRLFKDGDGAVWLLAHSPKGGFMTVAPVEAHCVTQPSGEVGCDLALGGSRVLWYTDMRKVEKNWVPHNGSSRMSYPHFPAFGPHSVLDWGSYQEPLIKRGFDSVSANETFFTEMNRLYSGSLEFAGSTPAVLYDDGVSYLAVGHVRAAATCFHDASNPAAAVQRTCEAVQALQGGEKRKAFFQFMHEEKLYIHHYKEYAFFFYRFLATPPYDITHVSLGLIPCAYYHSGVTFPSGLERIGPNGSDYLIAYGEANRYSRLLTISSANVRQVLVPIEQMRSAVQSYSLCSVPCDAQRRRS